MEELHPMEVKAAPRVGVRRGDRYDGGVVSGFEKEDNS